MCAHSNVLYQANTTHFSKVNRSLLTASTRFTTDLAKFLVCCFVLCRLYCVQTRKTMITCESCRDMKYCKSRHLLLLFLGEHVPYCGHWQSWFPNTSFPQIYCEASANQKKHQLLQAVFCHYDHQLDYTHTCKAIIQAWVKQSVLHYFIKKWDQRLTARFFLRFSQEKSSSSEKSCSSSTGNTNKKSWIIQNPYL